MFGPNVIYSFGANISKYQTAMRDMRRDGKNTADSLGAGWKIMGAAGTAALAGITSTVVSGTKSMAEFDRIQRRTSALVVATGNAAGFTSNEMVEFARALDLNTLSSRDQIMGAINVMQTFKSVQGDVFKRSIELSQDLSEVLGVDLRSQTVQLGKALEDPINGLTALRRVGVTFSESQQDLIKSLVEANKTFEAQSAILDAIAGQVGGAGKAAAGGLAGQIDELSFRWTEFKESLSKTDSAIAGISAINSALAKTTELLNTKFSDRSLGDLILQNLPGGQFLGIYQTVEGVRRGMQPAQAYDDIPAQPMTPDGTSARKEPSKEVQKIIDEQNKARLDMTNEYFEAAEKIEADWDKRRLEIKQNNYQKETELYIMSLEARYEAGEAAAQAEIEREERIAEIRRQQMSAMVENYKYAFKEFGKQSRVAFEAYKAIAIAETLIDTYKGAQAAFTALAGIPIIGPALGTAAAAAAIAAGLARVQAISSQQPGGSGGSPGGGGAVGTYSANSTTGLPSTDPAYASNDKKGDIHITVYGDQIGEPEWIDKIVDKINGARDRDVYITETRYARSLT